MKLPVAAHVDFRAIREPAFAWDRADEDAAADGHSGSFPELATGYFPLASADYFAAKVASVSQLRISSSAEMFEMPAQFSAKHLRHHQHGHHHHAGVVLKAPPSQTASATVAAAEGTISQAQVVNLKNGLESTLTSIAGNLNSQVFAETFPIVGDNFFPLADRGVAQLNYVTALKGAIASDLASLTASGPGPYTETQVESAFRGALAGFGSADLVLTNPADVKLNFDTARNFAAVPVPVEGDLGLPNLGLTMTTSGDAQSTFNYQLRFNTGLDGPNADTFYLSTAPRESFFSIVANTRLPGFSEKATLTSQDPVLGTSALKFAASDAGTLFNGNFEVTLKDPGGPGSDSKFRVGETGDPLDARLYGPSEIKLNLTTDMGGTALPQLSTQLIVRTSFGDDYNVVDPTIPNANFGSKPDVTFENAIDLASFFHGFASPVLGKIADIAVPFQPLINALTAKIPLLDILNEYVSNDIPETLLDFVGASPQEREMLKGLSDIIGLLQLANNATGTAAIDLGTLRVIGDLRVTPLSELSTTVARPPTAPGAQNAYLGNFLNVAGQVGANGDLSFPILQRPALMGELLLGKGNPEFFEYDPDPISIGPVNFRQFFPVLGPFGVTLGGEVGLSADFDFGFDTQGLRDFARTGTASDVFNGFFVRAFNDAGDPETYISVTGGLNAGVAVNVIVAEVGVGGGLTVQLVLPFDQNRDDAEGKVRGTTLANTNIKDLLAPGGEISAYLDAHVTIGIDPISKTWEFPIANTILWTSGQVAADPPVLINQLPDNSLRLNSGPRAALRERGNVKDTAEHFEVAYANPSPGIIEPFVVVKAFNSIDSVRADAVDTLVGSGGEFSDFLETTPDFPLPVIFFGGLASDKLISGAANDLLVGGPGRDTLLGHAGDDTLQGDDGDDLLTGGPGADALNGGAGRDVASYHTSSVAVAVDLRASSGSGDAAGDSFTDIEGVFGSPFDDVIEGSNGPDAPLSGGAGADTISGNDGDDVIDGGAGADTIYGGIGNDFIFAIARTGGDLIFGGEGIDTISFIDSPTIALVDLGFSSSSGNTLLQFESIVGTLLHFDAQGDPEFPGDDLTGTDGPNVIYGLSGRDALYGLGGDDVLYGNAPGVGGVYIYGELADPELPAFPSSDADKLYGGTGHDSLYGGDSADELYGEAGNDLLEGESGDDHLEGGEGVDRLFGGDGRDALYGGAQNGLPSNDTLDGGEGNDQLYVHNGNNQLSGGGGDDSLVGGIGDDTLDGGDGFDSLNGGTGNNQMSGGEKDDLLFALSGNDTMDGGGGNDYLDAQEGNNTMRGGFGNDTLLAAFGNDTIRGDGDDDRIDGGTGLNFLYGGSGNDTIGASFNDDYMEGNDGDDVMNAQGGNNTLLGGADNDWLITSGGNDTLDGGTGNDILDAGNGTDRLMGGEHDDVLSVGSLRSETQDEQRTDHLFGGAGFDTITADFSNQTVAMRIVAGTDNSLQFADGAEALNFENLRDFASGSGDDFIRLDGAADNQFENYLLTGAGHDTVFSGAANDYVDAADGNDFVNGGSNSTVLSFPGGVPAGTRGDTLKGGEGNDTVSFDGIVQFQNGNRLGVSVNLATNATGLGASGTVISGFENVIGTNYRDDLTGDDGPNIFQPLRGGGYGPSGGIGDPDRIDGAGGEDTLQIDFSLNDLPALDGVYTNRNDIQRNSRDNAVTSERYGYENVEHLDLTGASKGDSLYSWVRDFSDVLRGLGGNDTLGGNGGADTLLGGDGNDVLTAQGTFAPDYSGVAGGRDVLDGGAGDDVVEDIALNGTVLAFDAASARFQLDGGTGFDALSADFSNQTAPIIWDSRAPTSVDFADGAYFRNFEQVRLLATGSGEDALTQLGRLDNKFFMAGGNDTLNPGIGFDEVFGGAGDDLLILDYSVGDDATVSGIDAQVDARFISRRNVATNAYADWANNFGFERLQIIASTKDDNIHGLIGDDVIDVRRGSDIADGGTGVDLLRLDWSAMTAGIQGARLTFDASTGVRTLSTSDPANFQVVFSNFERLDLRGTELADSFQGLSSADTLSGGGGNDTLSGGNGADLLDGGPGNDTLNGGLGADILRGGDGDDVFDPGTSNDVQWAASVLSFSSQYTDTNWSAAQALGAPDTNAYGDSTRAWTPVPQNGTNEQLTLGFATPVQASGVTIRETWGNGFVTQIDLLDTADQLHTVFSGNDPSQPGAPADFTASFATTPYLVKGVKVYTDTNHNLSTWEEIDAVALLSPGTTGDQQIGGRGNDSYVVNSIADIVVEQGGEGTDTVSAAISYILGGNVENLVLTGRALNGTGNALANIITGNARNNVIEGGDGNDVLTGGLGIGLAGSAEIDRLNGGAGADTFVLGDTASGRFYDDRSSLTPGTKGYAQIDDFTPSAGDKLQLKGSAAEYFLGNSPVAGAPGTGLFHDTNFDGLLDPAHDELLAIFDSPDALTPGNTIDAALFA